MKIFVKAKPGAKEDKVIPPPPRLIPEPTQDLYIVSTRERPVEGRANKAITKLIAEHFGVSPSQVSLTSGTTSKRKVFEVDI